MHCHSSGYDGGKLKTDASFLSLQEGKTATDMELTGVFAEDRHDPIALANEPLLSVITPSETSNMCVFCFTILHGESERKRWGWRGGETIIVSLRTWAT